MDNEFHAHWRCQYCRYPNPNVVSRCGKCERERPKAKVVTVERPAGSEPNADLSPLAKAIRGALQTVKISIWGVSSAGVVLVVFVVGHGAADR